MKDIDGWYTWLLEHDYADYGIAERLTAGSYKFVDSKLYVCKENKGFYLISFNKDGVVSEAKYVAYSAESPNTVGESAPDSEEREFR